MTTENQKQASKTAYEMNKIKNDQIIEQQMQKQKIQQIQSVKQKIKILKQKFQSNVDYRKAQQQQVVLRDRIGNLDKNISGANFQLMQLAESIKMAELQKQKQIKQRKRLTEQFQSVKTMLMQILFMNLGRKQKQTQNRKRDSVEIQKAEYQTKKLQKNLDQIKKKLTKCQQTENQLRIQVQGLQRELQKLKKKDKSFDYNFKRFLQKINNKRKLCSGQAQKQGSLMICFIRRLMRSIYFPVSYRVYKNKLIILEAVRIS